MSMRIFEAIVSKWDTNTLDNTFTGGIWYDEAKSGVSFPYVVMTGEVSVDRRSSDSIIQIGDIEFTIWWKDDGSQDPASYMGSLGRTFLNVFEEKSLTIAADGAHVHFLLISNNVKKSVENAWFHEISMQVMRTRDRPT